MERTTSIQPGEQESRKYGFGATDLVALMGYQKNRTPNMVLDEKEGFGSQTI